MTDPHPVRLVVTDDLRRSRLTVFFRAFIAIPHYLWAAILGTAVFFGVFANWFILLVRGRTPEGLHNFIAGYIRYLMHVEAYFLLAANPFPGFYPFDEEPYPVDLKIDRPAPQNRWKTFFRLFLAIPAILISSELFVGGARTGGYFFSGLAFLVAFFCWFAALVRGRLPRGMRDLLLYCLGYSAQLSAYLFLLTDRYPYTGPEAFVAGGTMSAEAPGPRQWLLETWRHEREFAVLTLITLDEHGELKGRQAARIPSDRIEELTQGMPVPDWVLGHDAETPVAEPIAPPDQHPVHVSISGELRRSRLLVLFRLPLAIPHVVWLVLWTVVALAVALATWLCALVIGRAPRPFHRFLTRYVRYQTHLYAFLFMVGNPFPGFVGRPGSYPVDLQVPDPEPQKRLLTAFRLLLAFPALMISSGVYGLLWTIGFLGWFVALFLGRFPQGFREAGAYALRYGGQLNAYLFLLTARYPYSGPRADPASP